MGVARSGRTRMAAESAERRAEMLRLYTVARMPQDDIAKRFGVSQPAVSKAIKKALAERPIHGLDEWRLLEVENLLALERTARVVMARKHYIVSAGRIVTTGDPKDPKPTDERLIDDGPTLAAIDRLVAIARMRIDLLGLKAPVRVTVEAEALAKEIAELVDGLSGDDGTADAGS